MPTKTPQTISSTIRRSARLAKLREIEEPIQPSKFVSSAHDSFVNQSPLETTNPVQHHSVDIPINESKEDEVITSESFDCNVSNLKQHNIRDSNLLPDFDRSKKEKLQLPNSTDPIWKDINEELDAALPQIFPQRVLDNLPSQELIEKLDKWTYKFLEEKFGVFPPPTDPKPIFVKKPNKRMVRFRAQKSNLRKAVRTLERAGLKNSEAWKQLQRQRLVLIRSHNRLRRALLKASQSRATAKAEKFFKKDHWKYTKNLFNPVSAAGSPKFTKEQAENYFAPLYRDDHRDHNYEAMDTMERPPAPEKLFDLEAPTLGELHRSTRKKRNGAAAGLNGLSYVVYKKCPSLVFHLHRIILKIWERKDIPSDWAVAYIALIAKTPDLENPAEFRPIAVGNTAGKIFFTIIAGRLARFMLLNRYIKIQKQKGFLEGMSGCLEHSFVLWEALRNAKENTRAIVITWIDLANAYGSVRHNLIQFALDWYHVPKDIQTLIFNYYELLRAKIVTDDWSTSFFLFDIGCFQGCVLSAILFDCVFNLLLDFLEPMNSLGYKFTVSKRINMDQAYADDLALTTRTKKDNQLVLNRTDKWLQWTKTMRAKPKKCVSTAMRQFIPGNKPRDGCVPLSDTVYAPYDPLLTISGEPIRHIIDLKCDDDFKRTHFKFVGRWIHFHANADDPGVQLHIKKIFSRLMKTIDDDLTNGMMKLWMYQFGVLSNLAWPFFVHDLPLSLAIELDVIANRHLKKWAGLHRSADLGTLYRSRERFGLGLSAPSTHFKKMGVVKSMLLKHSADANVRHLYQDREKRESKFKTVWRASQLTTTVENSAIFSSRFKGQTNLNGLGHNRYNNNLSVAELRRLSSHTVSSLVDEELWSHSHTLAMHGLWTTWFEHTRPLDFSWKTLIFGPGKRIISFLLNATINTVSSPYLRHLMGLDTSAKCKLCAISNCNTSHILAGCSVALISKRYTWRHDSVLLTLKPELEKRIESQNNSHINDDSFIKPPPITSSFVMADSKTTLPNPSSKTSDRNILSNANDWKLLVDFDHDNIVFPPEIFSTDQRPDIVIWSKKVRMVLLIELTVPADENILAAQVRKRARYEQLSIDMKEVNNWNSKIITVEVGARGFVAKSMNSCLRQIGFTAQSASFVCKEISLIVARCSHHIWACRYNKNWQWKPLLEPFTPTDTVFDIIK